MTEALAEAIYKMLKSPEFTGLVLAQLKPVPRVTVIHMQHWTRARDRLRQLQA